MITNEAIKLASQIVEAQKKASTDGLYAGIFVCKDSKQGLYEFIKPENIIIGDQKLLTIIHKLNSEVSHLKDEIEILKATNKLLKEKDKKTDEALEMLKAALLELDTKVEEEGNIL